MMNWKDDAELFRLMRKELFTGLEADVYDEELEHMGDERVRKPFGLMFKALDDLKPDEVYICSGSSPR